MDDTTSATIPLSLQEPVAQHTLDVACMSTVWRFGFLLVFSALFSKTWRLNKLYSSGRAFRRVTVKPKDVIWPSVVHSIVNLGLLTCCAIITPWTWKRVPLDNYDSFGRSVESYGSYRAAAPSQVYVALGIQLPVFLPKFHRRRDVSFRRTMARSYATPMSRCGNVHVTINRLSNTPTEAAPGVTSTIVPNNNSSSSHGTAAENGEKSSRPAVKMGVSQVSRGLKYYQQLEMNHYRTCSRQGTASEST